jgi:hypothetical protein
MTVSEVGLTLVLMVYYTLLCHHTGALFKGETLRYDEKM